MKFKLLCKFKFEGARYATDIPSVSNIVDGFWVDDWFNYTVDPERTSYWIPPSKIFYVEKLAISE